MSDTQKQSYQELQKRLDDIIFDLQADSIDVDAVIAKYDEAKKIIKELEAHLKKAENKIKTVKSASVKSEGPQG